ncbi:GNAT family N-acetyltransferase [Acetobacter fallax]|uniref:GNAT family N-acetyltransferase n=1 Tax=Acetobacter fallax TaxID=1737473 RepID=UPI001F54A7C3|nr:GNAT family N-acetyltransferase [Acetobacter fallax]
MEPTTRAIVDVTFMEMLHPPAKPAPPLPAGWSITHEPHPSVAFYRDLYDRVGRDYCWWMRQVMSDKDLAALLAEPGRRVYLLREGQYLRGFFELETLPWNIVNLAYFGLLPDAIGRSIGSTFLSNVVDIIWAPHPLRVTVNTCSADHPRALPAYLKAGFEITAVVREIWDIPNRLGLTIPERLRPIPPGPVSGNGTSSHGNEGRRP